MPSCTRHHDPHASAAFLGNVVHELRTPLNAILGFAELLRSDAAVAALSPRQSASLAYIEQSARHLNCLVGDLLDLSRIEGGHLLVDLHHVSLPQVVGEALDMLQPLAARARVTLAADRSRNELAARADLLRLRQVLLNLVGNAIKYSRPGGHVNVDWMLDVGGESARISVSDDGSGLTRSQMERLFHPFDRLGAEASRVEGNGIGLVVTRSLVQLMHGHLDVWSEPGRGCVFTVVLPRA